jgi:hypothetical protein
MYLKKESLSTAIAISLFILSGCAPKYIYKANWQNTPVVIDGKTNDWEVPLRFFDTKTKLNYSVSNDAENLYICIRATDDDNVSGITKRGLQIWIDTTGKRSHQVGILCPIPKKTGGTTSENGEKHGGNGGSENIEEPAQTYTGIPDTSRLTRMHNRFIENAKQMHVSGFKTVPDGILALPDIYGINLGVSWNNENVLVYEIAIPFKSFLKYPLSPSDSSKILGISFNFTVTPKHVNNGEGGHGGGGGMHGGGMGGAGGGMGGGGGRHSGGGEGGGSSEPEPESIWTPFHLTTKQ